MPGPKFNKKNGSGDSVKDLTELYAIPTKDLLPGTRKYVIAKEADYMWKNGAWILIEEEEPKTPEFDQNNFNKVFNILEQDLATVDEAGIAAYLNALNPPLNIYEKENLYVRILKEMKPFITEWTVLAGETILLPVEEGRQDFVVNWGDGSPEETIKSSDGTSLAADHVYAAAGTYQVTITGICEWFYAYNDTKITGVITWGDCAFKYFSVRSCDNFSKLPMDETPDFYGCTDFEGAFMSTSLTELPPKLFYTANNATNFTGCFMWNAISSIPVGFMDKCRSAETVVNMFYENLLTAIPTDLFKYNTEITQFRGAFQLNQLTAIPAGLFDTNIKAERFLNTFRDNQLAAIPAGLFDNCPAAWDFVGTFSYNQLTAIPTDLFKYNTEALEFRQTFDHNLIEAIPAGLFDTTTKVNNFNYCFGYNHISTIPAGLFDHTPLVTDFGALFIDNSLTGIPTGLFDHTPLVTTLHDTFLYNQIEEIPAGLLDAMTVLETLQEVFSYNKLKTIPAGLFKNQKNVGTFYRAFKGNQTLTGPAPKLWETNSNAYGTEECFALCNGLSNWAEIPETWK